MGNAESNQLEKEVIIKDSLENAEIEIVKSQVQQIPGQPVPIRTNSVRAPIISDSLVTGSPLPVVDQDSVSSSYFGKSRKKDSIGRPQKSSIHPVVADYEYIQPPGERDYKNSSRIVHGYGPSGLAPLQSISAKKESTIPIMVVWSQPGDVVQVTGTFNNWQKKIRLRKSFEDFSTIVDMPPGLHQVKFIVDDEWRCSEDLPFAYDAEGNLVNEVEVIDEDGKCVIDGLQDVSSEYPTEIEVPDSPLSTYDCKIPAPPALDLNENHDGPPALPVHLQKVLLNSKSISAHDPYLLPLPNHVSVNHLYACSIRDGVMAIGSTFRYRKKVL